MNFQETLDAYLAAIQARDLDALVALLAPNDQLTLILPNGIYLTGYDEVAEFHRTWFSDEEWTLKSDLLHSVETDSMALALLLVDYDDLDPSGNPYHLQYYLSLSFVHVGDQWLLIHDQNTLVHEGR